MELHPDLQRGIVKGEWGQDSSEKLQRVGHCKRD